VWPKILDQEAASYVMELFPLPQYPLRRPVKIEYIILNRSKLDKQVMPIQA
jgi:hypothetical protein